MTTAAAVVCTLATQSVAFSQDRQVCARLESQLKQFVDAIPRDDIASRFDPGIEGYRANIEELRLQLGRLDCTAGSVIFLGDTTRSVCQPLQDQLAFQEAQLQRALNQREAELSGDNSLAKQRILAALNANGCSASDGIIIRDTLGVEGDEELVADPNKAYRTICVRMCDGYYYPVSFASTPDQFGRDAAQCARSCPGADVDLFFHSVPEQESDEMVSADDKTPYRTLPNAFAYRRSGSFGGPQCSCDEKPPSTGGIAVAPGSSRSVVIIDPNKGANPSSSIIDGEGNVIGVDPQADEEAQTQPQEAGPPSRDMDPTRRVRVVGPKFLPDQSEAIDLRAPVPTVNP
ncbi:MAG: DUF2865 domain-containing protein [Pseudomonadota bacterium]